MLKKFVRFLPILLVVLIVFSLVQSAPVQADSTNDLQVLIVQYQDRDQLADLVNRYDVVEVDSETQTVKIFSNQITRDALAAEGISWSVDQAYTAEINTVVKPLPWQTSGIPGYPCYRTIAEVFQAADDLATTYPDLVEIVDIGDSWEKTQNPNAGWDMEVLLLTNRTESVSKSDAFIMSGIHAREWAPPELMLRVAGNLPENYETDAEVTWLLANNRIHLIMLSNPDGRLQDEANTSWLWRKNTNNNYCTGGTGSNGRGADLNRNFPFAWENSGYQCDAVYSGPTQGSEPETQAIVDYVESIFPDQRGDSPTDPVNELTATGMFIDVHSYSELVLWPWGYTYSQAPNHASLRAMSYKFAYYNDYTPQQSVALYPTNGTTDDWAYGVLGVPGFCFEVGTSFHQSCSAFESEIYPDNQEALIRAIKIARRPYRLTHGPEVTNLSAYVNPGGLVVNYTADDTLYSTYSGGVASSNIMSIRYSIDKPSWITGSNPKTVELRTTVPKHSGIFSISLDGLAPGQHTLFVEALDNSGAWGPPTAIFFTVEGEVSPTPPTPTPPTPTPPTPTPPPGPEQSLYLPLIRRELIEP